LSRGTQARIEQGIWSFTLEGITVINGDFDAWIERGLVIPRFTGPHLSSECTISVPGTSNKVITVGSYITRGTPVGGLSSFSSQGPTRDGRQKPEIAAPGERIMSVKFKASGDDQYKLLRGTSMASPHVAGTIALMLQKDNALTQSEIKECLINSARSDGFTGATPNPMWGYGKLDAKGAFDCKEPLPSYTLTVNIIGSGNVIKTPDMPTYSGEVVQLTANPASGWSFSGWSGDLTGNNNPDNITMNENKVVTATFVERTRICAIALVTAGTMLLPHVNFLRAYRDETVLKSVFSKQFNWILDYYYKFSPRVVFKMKKSPLHKKLLKYFFAYPFVLITKRVISAAQAIQKVTQFRFSSPKNPTFDS